MASCRQPLPEQKQENIHRVGAREYKNISFAPVKIRGIKGHGPGHNIRFDLRDVRHVQDRVDGAAPVWPAAHATAVFRGSRESAIRASVYRPRARVKNIAE